MSVIIRLQNLPWSANAHDIRQYFHGLSIPEGGVHIVGGEKGDAFIAFSTDEDARQAFNRNNGKIKDAPVSLLLSSRTEMQKVIEEARTQSMAALVAASKAATPIVPVMPAIVPPATSSLSELGSGQRTDTRRRSRSRSRSHERRDRRHSPGRDRNRDRRRRSRSRSRSRERKNGDRQGNNTVSPVKPRVGVWEAPPQAALFNNATDSANLLANFVANNILPNILTGNSPQLPQLAGVSLQERLQLQAGCSALLASNSLQLNGFNSNSNNRQNFNLLNRDDDRNGMDRDGRDFNRNNANNFLRNNCVKVFPFFGGVDDILRFFSDSNLSEEDIVFTKDIFGNRNGQIYVNFAYPEFRDEALGQSGGFIRHLAVTIEPVSDLEFSTEFLLNRNLQAYSNQNNDGIMPNNRLNDRNAFIHLKIEVLPSFANSQDVRNIFRDYPLASVLLEQRGRLKTAFIKFVQAIDADDALSNRNAHMFEGKPIDVSICYDDEFEEVAHRLGADTSAMQAPTHVIAMTGLPPKCSDRDIIDFFSDIGVMPAKINMIPNESGFVDEAICTFYNVDDAVLGFQKNGTLFGNHTVSLKYEPVNDAPGKSMMMSQMNRPMNMMRGQHQQEQDNRPYFEEPNPRFNGPMRGGGMRSNNMPMQMNNQQMGGGDGRDGGRNMPQQMRRFPPHSNHHLQLQDYQDDVGDDDALAPPGYVLLMENVPYKAGVDEILNFLGGFNVPCENVLRKYNSNGLPSGEAKIIFNNPEDVFHAIQQNRGRRIWDRPIQMTQI